MTPFEAALVIIVLVLFAGLGKNGALATVKLRKR